MMDVTVPARPMTAREREVGEFGISYTATINCDADCIRRTAIVHVEKVGAGSRVECIECVLDHLPPDCRLFLFDLLQLDFALSLLFCSRTWSRGRCPALSQRIRFVRAGDEGEDETREPELRCTLGDLLVGFRLECVCLAPMHPLKGVKGEVCGIAELPGNGRVADEWVLNRGGLKCGLEVLKELADTHD